MDEIWEEIDLAESEGQLCIEVSEYRLNVEDIVKLESMGYQVQAGNFGDTFQYYIISWELV